MNYLEEDFVSFFYGSLSPNSIKNRHKQENKQKEKKAGA